MVIVIEPLCVGNEHAQFNSAMLSIAGLIARDGLVTLWAQDEHLEAVKRQRSILEDDCIVDFKSIEVPPRHSQSISQRLPVDIKILTSILAAHASEHVELVVITCVTESMLLAAKIKLTLSRLSAPVIVIFHSILPSLLTSRKRRYLLTIGTPSQMKLVVLGEHISKNLKQSFPSLGGKLFPIEHPYHFRAPDVSHKNKLATKFGFIGLGNNTKGFPLFLQLVQSIGLRCHDRGTYRFEFIGRVAPDCNEIFQEFLDTPSADLLVTSSNKMLPRDEFESAVAEIDYLIMPYDDEFYKFVYSGSSLDAVSFLKPIIALRGSFFESMFSGAGDIGYLCDSLEDMVNVVHNLIQTPDPGRWKLQQGNLLSARQRYSPATIAGALKRIIN